LEVVEQQDQAQEQLKVTLQLFQQNLQLVVEEVEHYKVLVDQIDRELLVDLVVEPVEIM
tara:strand:- start:315 stop:491 length:177 start_codon:yes stop_codon:yes gene_type:complete